MLHIGDCGSRWLVLHDKFNRFELVYLYYYLGSKSLYEEFCKLAQGGVVNNLNTNLVKSVNLPLPPLDLQQQFAEKVKAIEAQKDVLKQSIAEFENLLAQRMELHFA